jgi:signal transduction histidine kinase
MTTGRFHNRITTIEDEAPHKPIIEGAQAERELASCLQTALACTDGLLQEELRERLRLESEIVNVIEREQRRLGQELHDGLSQQLTGIAYQLSALHTKLVASAPDLAETIQTLGRLIQDSVEQTRKLAKGLYPVALERDGFMSAVLELAQHTQQAFGVRCVVQAGTASHCNLPEPLATQLFRITQEALHNAVKHAQAKRVIIRLAAKKENIALRIEDDGIGLPPDVESSNGMGLRIMQHHARSIRGTLEFRNREAGGAIVSCVVPAGAWLSHNGNGDREPAKSFERVTA